MLVFIILLVFCTTCCAQQVVYRNGSTSLCEGTDIRTVLAAVEELRSIVYTEVHSVAAIADAVQHLNTDPNHLTELESNVTELMAAVDNLKVTSANEAARLEIELAATETSLQSQIDHMASTVSGLSQQLADQSSKVSDLEEHIAQLTSSGITAEPLSSSSAAPVIGFTAYLDGIHNPSPGSTVPFTGVDFNHGSHYSTATSKFTCPVYGMYFFTFMLYSNEMTATRNRVTTTEASIMRNGFRLVQTCCENSITGMIKQQCGNTVVTQCDAAQQIWIETNWNDNKIYGEADWRETTFAGFLIQPL